MTIRERILLAGSACAAGAAVLLAGGGHFWLRGLKFDDAWIHLRYAANLASGKGFVFNEGERVLGSAGVLWNWLLAAFAAITSVRFLPSLVSVLNCAALLACAFVVCRALWGIVPGWYALLVAASLMSMGPLVVSSIGGMETTVLCLLYFLCLWALVRRRFVAAGLCAGAALCCRVESFPLMSAVLIASWLYERKKTWMVVLALALAPAVVFGWCWWYFGSPVANSTMAKHAVYVLRKGDALRACGASLLQVLPFDKAFPFAPDRPEWSHAFGLLLWTALVFLGYARLRRGAPAAAGIILQALIPVAFYGIANPLFFPWYHCTFVPVATVLALVGIYELGSRIAPARPALADYLALAVVVSFSITPLQEMWGSSLVPGRPEFSFQAPNARESARTYQYANIAQWLNERSTARDRACLSEIGAFGYHYRGRVLDGLGLVSPEVLRFHPVAPSLRPGGQYGVIPPAMVREFQPEFVVSLDVFAGALFSDPWFLGNYEEMGRWSWFGGPARWRDLPPSLWGGSEIRAYRRRSGQRQ